MKYLSEKIILFCAILATLCSTSHAAWNEVKSPALDPTVCSYRLAIDSPLIGGETSLHSTCLSESVIKCWACYKYKK